MLPGAYVEVRGPPEVLFEARVEVHGPSVGVLVPLVVSGRRSGRQRVGDLLQQPLASGVALDVTPGIHVIEKRAGALEVLEFRGAIAFRARQLREEPERFDEVERHYSTVRIAIPRTYHRPRATPTRLSRPSVFR